MKNNKFARCDGLVVAAIAGALLLSGCASTYQKRSVKGSGFLTDYSQLAERGGDAALLSYINPTVDFNVYTKILLEPVRAYAANKGSSMSKLPKEKQQDLLNYFDAALREQLKKDFALVSQPGPGVIRLRVAITEAEGSMVLLDTISSIVPISMVLSSAQALVTGKHLSVGEIGAECEGLDSVSGLRLFAAVDARVGRKYTLKFDKFNRWHTAQDACDFWAEQLRSRLIEKRKKAPAVR